LIGPLLAANMAVRMGPMALAAALLLEVAVRCYRALLRRTVSRTGSRSPDDKRLGASMLAGITLILRSRYLLRLVVFMLLHTSADLFVL
jgi:ATP:ADP antiporter, AAA family